MKANDIVNIVAKYFNIQPEDIYGKSRKNNICLARQIAIYLIYKFIPYLSKIEIGNIFNRNVFVIHYSIKEINSKLTAIDLTNQKIKKVINELINIINTKESEPKPKQKNKYIVILGPINNDPNWKIKFNKLKAVYTHIYPDYLVLTPLETDEIAEELYGPNCGINEWEAVFLKYLCLADIVVCAKGYNNGGMSELEYNIALKLNKKIIYDENRWEVL